MTTRPKDVSNLTPEPAETQAQSAHGRTRRHAPAAELRAVPTDTPPIGLQLTSIGIKLDRTDAVVTVSARGPVPMKGTETTPVGQATPLSQSWPLEMHWVLELIRALERHAQG